MVKKPGEDGGWRFRHSPGWRETPSELLIGRSGRRHVIFHARLVLGLKLGKLGFLIGGQNLHHFRLDAGVLYLEFNLCLCLLRGKGAGLGLAIVRRLCELYGWDVSMRPRSDTNGAIASIVFG